MFASVLVPEKADVVAPAADGVSSLRDDYFLLRSGVHPLEMIETGSGRELEETIYRGVRRTAELFAGKPVWYKTMDAPTDEFRRLAGGEREPTSAIRCSGGAASAGSSRSRRCSTSSCGRWPAQSPRGTTTSA